MEGLRKIVKHEGDNFYGDTKKGWINLATLAELKYNEEIDEKEVFLPKGTKRAVVCSHADGDGVMSAALMAFYYNILGYHVNISMNIDPRTECTDECLHNIAGRTMFTSDVTDICVTDRSFGIEKYKEVREFLNEGSSDTKITLIDHHPTALDVVGIVNEHGDEALVDTNYSASYSALKYIVDNLETVLGTPAKLHLATIPDDFIKEVIRVDLYDTFKFQEIDTTEKLVERYGDLLSKLGRSHILQDYYLVTDEYNSYVRDINTLFSFLNDTDIIWESYFNLDVSIIKNNMLLKVALDKTQAEVDVLVSKINIGKLKYYCDHYEESYNGFRFKIAKEGRPSLYVICPNQEVPGKLISPAFKELLKSFDKTDNVIVIFNTTLDRFSVRVHAPSEDIDISDICKSFGGGGHPHAGGFGVGKTRVSLSINREENFKDLDFFDLKNINRSKVLKTFYDKFKSLED